MNTEKEWQIDEGQAICTDGTFQVFIIAEPQRSPLPHRPPYRILVEIAYAKEEEVAISRLVHRAIGKWGVPSAIRFRPGDIIAPSLRNALAAMYVTYIASSPYLPSHNSPTERLLAKLFRDLPPGLSSVELQTHCDIFVEHHASILHAARADRKERSAAGQTASEYALLLAAILLLAATSFYAFGCNVRVAVNRVDATLSAAK